MEIKVLGTGCPRCKALEQMIRNVVAEMNITAEIEKVDGQASKIPGDC